MFCGVCQVTNHPIRHSVTTIQPSAIVHILGVLFDADKLFLVVHVKLPPATILCIVSRVVVMHLLIVQQSLW